LPATEADVEKAIRDTDALMPDVSAERVDPIIDATSQEQMLTYLIDGRVTKEYPFDVMEYELDFAGDLKKIDYAELRRALDHAHVTKTPFPDLVAKVGISAGNVTAEVESPLFTFLEYIGIIDRIVKLDVARVEIAIKGYADGEREPWTPVKALGESYTSFQVLHPRNPELRNWTFYRKPERLREVSFPYRNADLPDLRAQFVRTEFIEPFLKERNCRCDVYVLHNKPIEEPEQAQMRKAQVYVMVYLKRPPSN
jgi:hypothetical protein